MPHGLGSGADFGHEDMPLISDGENAWVEGPAQNQGNIRRIEDEVAAINQEILGPEQAEDQEWLDAPLEQPFESAEVGEYLGPSEADLMAYLESLQAPRYYILPGDLVSLVEKEILSVEEARNYLVSQGVELG